MTREPRPNSEASTLDGCRALPLEKGNKIGDFEILALLGAGGMGEVYQARDPRLKRDVALKVLHAPLTAGADWRQRFEREARAAASLNHPNIVAVYQFGQHGSAPYLVSELLTGTTLRDQLKSGPMPPRRAIEYAIQIASGLSAAHDKGIVHRDLKPENLFVTNEGRVKILDFGVAKLINRDRDAAEATSNHTEAGRLLGTIGYMAPEQLRGEAADQRSDIFALGCVLYEMLAGVRPFRKTTASETIAAILHEDPQPLAGLAPAVSAGLHRIVHRCLEKNPNRRFQSASDLRFALEAISEAGDPPRAPTPRGLTLRNRYLWMAGLVITIAIAAGSAVWLSRPQLAQIGAIKQLTNDGEPKPGRLVTDGARILFNEGRPGSFGIAEVSATGSETAVLHTVLENPQILDIANDGSALLAAVGNPAPLSLPLWSIPLPAGEPRRFGNIEVQDASMLPDGRLLFTDGSHLNIADRDGGNPRHLFSTPTVWVYAPAASPDGNRISFTSAASPASADQELDEIAADGTHFRRLVTSTAAIPSPCCAKWTADGKYLVFQSLNRGRWDLWAMASGHSFLNSSSKPMPLTDGPLSYSSPVPSHDGKAIFAIGSHRRGEVVSYDPKTGHFVPYLSGISAMDVSFSGDGKWVAYASYPERTVWRSRADGTERRQLTYPPLTALVPAISSDGAKVAFVTPANETYITQEGVVPQKLSIAASSVAWSPDGNSLILTTFSSGQNRDVQELKTLDLRNGRVSTVAHSLGMIGAFWLKPDTIVAANRETSKFRLFNFRTQAWRELASGSFVNWYPSLDGKYLYVTTGGVGDPQLQRIRIADGYSETITGLKNLRRAVDSYYGTQVNVAPDGSALFTRDLGSEEIYALTVRWP